MIKQIFVNLSVKNLNKTMKFFSKVGFRFNPQFTDKNATCLILGKNIFAMLMTEKTMKRFTKKKVINTRKNMEVINSLFLGSRREVDQMMKKVKAAGGKETRKADDYGWMYGRAFQDIDGHLWEVFYMNIKKAPKTQK